MLSIRGRPAQSNPMHASSLLRCVVKGCQMLSLCVVPYDKIAGPPFVAVHKIRPHQVGKEIVKLSLALRGLYSNDFGCICSINVDASLVAEWMLAEHRMCHIRCPIQLLF